MSDFVQKHLKRDFKKLNISEFQQILTPCGDSLCLHPFFSRDTCCFEPLDASIQRFIFEPVVPVCGVIACSRFALVEEPLYFIGIQFISECLNPECIEFKRCRF